MNKFLIVDGSNLLFQMFFGMPARIVNGAGKPIQKVIQNVVIKKHLCRKKINAAIYFLF